MDFSYFLQRKSEVVFTLKAIELDINSACLLFILNYYMFPPHDRRQENLIRTHCLLPEAVHIIIIIY
jgi:hypothetical protein